MRPYLFGQKFLKPINPLELQASLNKFRKIRANGVREAEEIYVSSERMTEFKNWLGK